MKSLPVYLLAAAVALGCSGTSTQPPPPPAAGPPTQLPNELAGGAPERERGTRDTLPSGPPIRLLTGQAIVSPAVRVDAGGTAQAAETALASFGDAVVAAWNDQREPREVGLWRLGAAVSTDGGATWSEGIVRPDANVDDVFEGDPMATVDPRTGNLWIGGVRFHQNGNLFVARLRPGAAAFDPSVVVSEGADIGVGYDKPLIAAGPAPGDPSSTYLYIGYSGGLDRSTDLGATWAHVDDLDTPLGLEVSQHPRIAADGTLYVTSWEFEEDGRILLRRSSDGGGTIDGPFVVATRADFWATQDGSRVPGDFRHPPIPVFARTADGTLVVVFSDTASVDLGETDLDLFLTRSTDNGATWSEPSSLHSEVGGDQVVPWLEADAAGRLHLVHLDTRFHTQSDNDPVGLVDVVYAFSDDAGATWRETRVSEVSTSTADAVWIGGYEFLGDYLGLTVLDDGDVMVLYVGAPGGGDLDVFARRISTDLFRDGFESGDLTAWSSASP